MVPKKFYNLFIFVILLLIITACSNDNSRGAASQSTSKDAGESAGVVEETITVSAAASLTDALNDISELFKGENSNVQIDYNFGGSGALRQQISQGAPVDIFFSASESDFQALVDGDYINEKNALDLLANELVLITQLDNDSVTSFADLSSVKKIAIGNPESVPAGAYSVEAFETMGAIDKLEELFIYAEDVRSVLTYVETGNVDAGIVYRTDAMVSDKVEIVDGISSDSHNPIIYPVGLIAESESSEATKAFYEYLQTDTALEVFEGYGFVIQ